MKSKALILVVLLVVVVAAGYGMIKNAQLNEMIKYKPHEYVPYSVKQVIKKGYFDFEIWSFGFDPEPVGYVGSWVKNEGILLKEIINLKQDGEWITTAIYLFKPDGTILECLDWAADEWHVAVDTALYQEQEALLQFLGIDNMTELTSYFQEDLPNAMPGHSNGTMKFSDGTEGYCFQARIVDGRVYNNATEVFILFDIVAETNMLHGLQLNLKSVQGDSYTLVVGYSIPTQKPILAR